MRKIGYLMLAALAGAWLVCLMVPDRAGAQSGRGWMKGFVVDESDVHGIPGAVVELTGDPGNPRLKDRKLMTSADDRGEYSFPEVPYGRFIFRVSAPGRRVRFWAW